MSLTVEAPPVDFAEEIAAFMEQITTAPANGMISGHGSWHTNKNGRNPYKRLEWSDIVGMVDKPQPGIDKAQAQWLIPSSLDSRVFKEQESGGSFYALWADLDKDPPALDVVAKFADAALKGADYEIYTSRSAREDYPKSRILVPLSEPLSGVDWVMAQRAFNARLEAAGIVPDPANERAAQLCYLPNRGEFYDTRSCRDGKRFDPLKVWSDTLQKIRQSDAAAAAALKAESEAKRLHREKILAEDVGNTGPSLIDAFNATHSVADILTGSGYEDRGNTFRHPLSESGSFSASVKDGRVHSLSSSDPLYTEGGGVGAHDAFSAFQVLFHQGDQNNALKDAGDKWVMVGDESWNTVRRRKFAESKAKPAFSLTHVSELLQPPKPLTWLVREYLLPETLAFIIGPPAAGKSLIALDWAACIASGNDWHGRSADKGAVIYLAGEGHFGIRRRLMAWQCHTGISLQDAPLAISDVGASLTDDASVNAVIEAIDAFAGGYGKPTLIIIDTLHRNFGAGDENSAQDMGLYFTNLDILRSRYRCSIVTVHHSGHLDSDRGRGSSSIRAAVDTEYLVKPSGEGLLSMKCEKMKDAPKPPPLGFKIVQEELPWLDDEGKNEVSVTIEPLLGGLVSAKKMPPSIRFGMESLADAIGHHGKDGAVHIDAWRKVFYAGSTAENDDAKRKAFQRCRNDLTNGNVATVENDFYRLTDCTSASWTDAVDLVESRCFAADFMDEKP